MQASFRHAAGQADSNQLVWNQTSEWEKVKINFSKVHFFSCFKLQQKQNLFQKYFWEIFLIEGVPKQGEKSSCLVLGKIKVREETNIIFFCYTSYLKVFPNSYQEQV